MSITIDSNMSIIADKLRISSSRMSNLYSTKTIDEIIAAEAAQGNSHAIDYAQQNYTSAAQLIRIFQLTTVTNKLSIIKNMNSRERHELLPLLDPEDLVMGLYFFEKDKLLQMLFYVDVEEVVNMMLAIFDPKDLIDLIPEEELANFFKSKDLKKEDIEKQLKKLPSEFMQKFIEGVTGQSANKTKNPEGIVDNINSMPEKEYREFISQLNPDIQRRLVYQITEENPKYFNLFGTETYVQILRDNVKKKKMIPAMINLEKKTLVGMIGELPDGMMSAVISQIDTNKFADFLLKGHLDALKGAF